MDRFTNTTFFPDYDSTSKMMDCVETNIPVFTEDLFENDGRKKFFACGYDFFITTFYKNKFLKGEELNMYELLQYDLPSKIYFDFDSSSDKGPIKELVIAFLEHARKSIQKSFGVADVDMIVLDSSSPKKNSYHVIIQLFLENIPMVGAYACKLMDEFEDSKIYDILDSSVYSRNRSFRLIYSSKKGRESKLCNLQTSSFDEYSEKDVVYSLIQNLMPRHYTGVLNEFVTPQYIAEAGTVHTVNVPLVNSSVQNSVCVSQLPDKLVHFLQRNGGEIKTTKLSGTFLSCIVAKTKCPFIKDYHKNNNQFFTLNTKNQIGWFSCPDESCPDVVYLKQKFSWAYV